MASRYNLTVKIADTIDFIIHGPHVTHGTGKYLINHVTSN